MAEAKLAHVRQVVDGASYQATRTRGCNVDFNFPLMHVLSELTSVLRPDAELPADDGGVS